MWPSYSWMVYSHENTAEEFLAYMEESDSPHKDFDL
jgi:hypothetical protein